MALKIIVGDVTIGVQGKDFSYIFSTQTGGMESLYREGKEWLYRTPKPAFWRAATDNDKGNGFAYKSAMWMGADAYVRCVKTEAWMDKNRIAVPLSPGNNSYSGREYCDIFQAKFTYEAPTVPKAEAEICYEVVENGDIHVQVRYSGKRDLPELPVFGMRFLMPTPAERFCYEGLSGETYPDRMAGGEPGVYEIKGLPVTPYLVPQDCGVHMQTKWVKVYRKLVLDNTRQPQKETCLRFWSGEEGFAFSALPFTSLELENATHQEELPPVRRTVLSIFGAVRGVGGIDSWGADVEPQYHIPADQDIEFSFWIGGKESE